MAARWGRMGAMTAGVAAVLALAACGGGETYTLDGAVVLRSADDVAVGEQDGEPICAGREGSGYEDILGGEGVTVANGEGDTLKETTLGAGEPSADGTECTFPWQVTELPEADQYLIQIAEREPVPYSLDELRQDNFEVVLALTD